MQSDEEIEQIMQEIADEGSYPETADGEEDVTTNTSQDQETIQRKPGTVPNIDGAGR